MNREFARELGNIRRRMSNPEIPAVERFGARMAVFVLEDVTTRSRAEQKWVCADAQLQEALPPELEHELRFVKRACLAALLAGPDWELEKRHWHEGLAAEYRAELKRRRRLNHKEGTR